MHERLTASREIYLRHTGGVTYGRPVNAIDSPYLLTGFASCGACGGSLFMHSHAYRNTRRPFYACTVYHQRGRAICKNNLEVSTDITDEAVLSAVERDVLKIEVLETSLYKAIELLRPPKHDNGTRWPRGACPARRRDRPPRGGHRGRR